MRHVSRNSFGFPALFVAMLCVWSADVLAQPSAVLDKPIGSAWFGFSVATDGEYVVVGDPGFDEAISQSRGAAIVYRHDGAEWVQDAMLIPNVASTDLLQYGYSVAIDQDIIVVGAQGDWNVCIPRGDCSMGSASVFRREAEGWVYEAKLFPADIQDESRFGIFVSVSDGRALVSASRDRNEAGEERGAIYVFRREGTTWVDEARLAPSDIADGSAVRFPGPAQAIDGERLIIGATTSDGAGAAYIFRRVGTTWTEEAKLVPPDPANGDRFGSVDLSGDIAVVGGVESNAFVYRRRGGGWSADGTLSNLDIFPNVAKPTSVKTDGINVLVATISGNQPAPPPSTTSVYRRNDSGWIRVSVLEPTEDAIVSIHAVPTDMRGGLVTIAARLPSDTFDFSSSTVYIFRTPAGAVPALTAWGAVIMALILVTAATWIVRRRIDLPLGTSIEVGNGELDQGADGT